MDNEYGAGQSAGVRLYETSKYRCLVKQRKPSNDIYLTLCGVEQCLPEYEFHTQQRPGYHLHVILSGKGVLCVRGQEHELHFGQMFMTKPGEETWYRADRETPWAYCWATFDGNNARRYAESAGFHEGVNWCDCHVDQQRFYSLVRGILDQPELTLAHDLLHTGLLLEYIALAIESNYQSEQGPRHEREYTSDVYVEYAVNYIQANYPTAKISDVARYIGIHRSYLTNLFKQKMGVSPQEYLLQYRLKRSSQLLLSTQMTIQEVAHKVGYENPLTFSKIFKNFYGVSPKFYRLSHEDGAEGGAPRTGQ